MMDIYIPNTSFMPTVINKETQLQCQNTGKHYDMCNGMYVNQTGGEWNTVNVNEYRKNISEQFSRSEQQKNLSNHETSARLPSNSYKDQSITRERTAQQRSQIDESKEMDAFELENSYESVSKNNLYNCSILDMKYERKAIVQTLGCVLQTLVDSNADVTNFNITKFHASRPPSISIQDYLQRINRYSSCSQEVLILALIYIDNLIKESHICLNNLNVHRILITAVMLAAKFFDDQYYNNAYYAKVGGVPREEMNQLEIEFLFAIRFSLRVDPKKFNKYQTELTNHAVSHCNNCNEVLRSFNSPLKQEPCTTSSNPSSTPVPTPRQNVISYNQEESLAPDYMKTDFNSSHHVDTNSLTSFQECSVGGNSNGTLPYGTIGKINASNMPNNANRNRMDGVGLPRCTNSSGTLVDQYIVENNAFIRCDSYASTNSGYYEVTTFDRENSNSMFTNLPEDNDRHMIHEGLYSQSDESINAITNIPGNFDGLQEVNMSIFNSNLGNQPNHCKLLYQHSTSSNGFGGTGQTDSTSSSLTPSPSSMSSWSPNDHTDTPATRMYPNMQTGSYALINSQTDFSKGGYISSNTMGQGNAFQQDPKLFFQSELSVTDKYVNQRGMMTSTPVPTAGQREYAVVSKEQANNSLRTKKNISSSMYFEPTKWTNAYPSHHR